MEAARKKFREEQDAFLIERAKQAKRDHDERDERRAIEAIDKARSALPINRPIGQ
jgi:hypothetical protein